MSLVGTALTLAKPSSTENAAVLAIGNDGNDTSFRRPFDGYLDNMRIWGDTTGNSGALTLAQLEAVRALDVSPIPEPSAFAFIAGLGALVLAASRRRRA